MDFKIKLGLPNGTQVLEQTVKADSWDIALSEVLENFKRNALVSDSQSWNVAIELIDSHA